MIWSFDPGDKRIGWAAWNERGVFIDKGIWTPESALKALSNPHTFDDTVSKFVIEDWKMRPGKTRGGSRMVSSRFIGQVELLAKQLGIELIVNPTGILQLTALHANVTLPRGHVPDDVSAYLHGYYYFEQKGILKPVSMQDRN